MANRRYQFKFNTIKDALIIKRLDNQKNMQQYIRSLVLSDIAADSLQGIFKVVDKTDSTNPEWYVENCAVYEDPTKTCATSGCKFYIKMDNDGVCERDVIDEMGCE